MFLFRLFLLFYWNNWIDWTDFNWNLEWSLSNSCASTRATLLRLRRRFLLQATLSVHFRALPIKQWLPSTHCTDLCAGNHLLPEGTRLSDPAQSDMKGNKAPFKRNDRKEEGTSELWNWADLDTRLPCWLSRAAVWNQPAGSHNELIWMRAAAAQCNRSVAALASSLIKCVRVRAWHASRSEAMWLSFIYLFILDLTLFHLFTCKAQTSECWVCSFVHFLVER